jgi:hypothetical protein
MNDDIKEREFNADERAGLCRCGFNIWGDNKVANIRGDIDVQVGPWDTGDLCHVRINLPSGHEIEGDMICPEFLKR